MLPKIEYPINTFVIPSTKEKIKFRSFNLKEEKMLLLATSSNDQDYINTNLTQVVNNCILSETDFTKWAYYDVELFIIKLRASSVNNIIEANIKNEETGVLESVYIDLNKVEVVIPENRSNNIKITEEVGMIVKDMTYDQARRMSLLLENQNETTNENLLKLFYECVEQVYDENSVYIANKDFTIDELTTFIEEIPRSSEILVFDELMKWFSNTPYLYLKVFTSSGKEFELKGISSFLV